MRILHVITALGRGGAETMLLKLLQDGRENWESAVVSLGTEGRLATEIAELGIAVRNLNLSSSFPNPFRLLPLVSFVSRFRPQIIQGWMPHGNLAAALAGVCSLKRIPVLWNIRMSLYDVSKERKLTAAVIRFGAKLSWYPAKIIYNSRTGAEQHEAIGYRASKRVVIPNGFDCRLFRPSDDAKREVRKELGLESDAILVGLIARYHPMKDHAGFLRAAGFLARHYSNVYFLLAGSGVTCQEERLAYALTAEQLEGRVFLLGERSDIPRLTAALDIACSASAWGEGFSNAIGEAMACGVPCVVTDIGESAFIISNTGLSVKAGDSQALAQALGTLIDAPPERRRSLGDAARQRVEGKFSLPAITQRYRDLYQEILAQRVSAQVKRPLPRE